MKVLCGISKTAFYAEKDKTMPAIVECKVPLLDNLNLPQTEACCKAAAEGIQSISYGGAVQNFVAVHDGYLMLIPTLSAKEVSNVRVFFYGHYQGFGVNVQAASNAFCCFVFIGIAGPGVGQIMMQ